MPYEERLGKDALELAEAFRRLLRIYESENEECDRPAWVVSAARTADRVMANAEPADGH